MTFSIEDFKSNGLVYGGARPSLFKVIIPNMPNGDTGGTSGANLTSKISYLAKAASLPPSIIDYIDVPYMSRKIRVNGDRTFPDWTITIMNDEVFDIRRAFEAWHQYINSREPNRQFGPGLSEANSYKVDLLVHQYSKTGNGAGAEALSVIADDAVPIATYTMVGAFPTSIGPIGLDWDYVNQIEQFDVTFTYDYWEPYVIEGNAPSSQIPVGTG